MFGKTQKDEDLKNFLKRPPQTRICPRCGGKGYYDVIGEMSCPVCAGTGRDLNSELMSLPCLACRGKRRTSYSRCVPCDCLHR